MEQTNRNASFSKIKIIKNLSVLSIAFLLLYTAYNGLTMLQSTMNKIQGIGTTGQAVLYITYGLSSLLISSYAIKKLGIKVAQILGMLLYLPYIAANFYPSWLTIIPSAVLLGIGSTLNWGAQCTYFNECAVLYNKIVNKSRNMKSINLEQVYMRASPNNCTSNVQISENQAPSNCVKQVLNKDDRKSSSYSINASSLHSKNISNGTSENFLVNENQSSKKIKNETSSAHGIAETFVRTKNDSNTSKSLKNTPLDAKVDLSSFSTTERSAQKEPISLSSTNALFFGFHGMAYCSSQIWSNLICFSVLSYGITENFNKTLNCSCGAGFCDTDEECVDESIEEVPRDTRYFLTGLCVVLGAIGALSVWLFLDPLDKREENVSFSFDQFLVTIRYFKKKEQFFLIPLTILGGMIQAFYTADVTKAYIACAWTLSQVGMVTVFYGVSSALSSLLSGALIKYVGRIAVIFMCQTLNVANLVFLLLWKPSAEESFTFYIEGAIFGFIVGVFHTQTKALYGTFFEGDEETAFSSCNMYSSIGWSLPFLYSLFLCTSVKIYILITLSCVGIVGYLLSERSFRLRIKELKRSDMPSHSNLSET